VTGITRPLGDSREKKETFLIGRGNGGLGEASHRHRQGKGESTYIEGKDKTPGKSSKSDSIISSAAARALPKTILTSLKKDRAYGEESPRREQRRPREGALGKTAGLRTRKEGDASGKAEQPSVKNLYKENRKKKNIVRRRKSEQKRGAIGTTKTIGFVQKSDAFRGENPTPS